MGGAVKKVVGKVTGKSKPRAAAPAPAKPAAKAVESVTPKATPEKTPEAVQASREGKSKAAALRSRRRRGQRMLMSASRRDPNLGETLGSGNQL